MRKSRLEEIEADRRRLDWGFRLMLAAWAVAVGGATVAMIRGGYFF